MKSLLQDAQSLVMFRWVAPHPKHANLVFEDGCPGENGVACSFSYPMFRQIQAKNQVLSGVFAFFASC